MNAEAIPRNQPNNSEPESKLAAPVTSSALSPQEPLSPKSLNNQVEHFVGLVNRGIDCWIEAGKLLVTLRNADAQTFKKILAVAPWITADILTSFCRIGEGRLHPRVLLLPKCPAYAEIISAPIEVQERIISAPIDVVFSVSNNQPRVTKMWARELDKKSTALVFKNGIIRTVEQQVAKLKTDAIVPAKTWSPPPVKAPDEFPKMNSVPVQTVLVSMGCWIVGFDGNTPFLVKRDGIPLANTQTIICKLDSSNTLGAVIEFKKWKVK